MTASRRSKIPAGAWPRGLEAAEAAAYVGESEPTFLAGVAAGDWPPAHHKKGRVRIWDKHQLDAAFDRRARTGGTSPATVAEPDLDAEFGLAGH